ncbi:TIM barrel protein [Stappia sp.]|uniref:TIM barrel protein n=1 Tax=Stappia sp. TaxID=1870903 RepID=UPI003C7CB8C0
MPQYALKAAVMDADQLADRAIALRAAGLPVVLELHTFGPRDLEDAAARRVCLENLDRLRQTHGPLDLTVHVPLQKVARVTEQDFDADQVEDALRFAGEAGAGRVVIHRYWGLVYGDAPQRANRPEATAGFNAEIARLARLAPEILLLVENVGHYSLLPRDGRSFLAGPLDHFFPWEIAAFRAFVAAEGLTNVAPFVDTAHATLSSNLFNWRRAHPAATKDDPRFSAVLDEDLERAERLHPFDFFDDKMPFLHVSDSLFYPDPANGPADIPLDALVTEGLEVGTGNLPWDRFPDVLGQDASTALVLEVEPGAGESHRDNRAQARSLAYLRRCFEAD